MQKVCRVVKKPGGLEPFTVDPNNPGDFLPPLPGLATKGAFPTADAVGFLTFPWISRTSKRLAEPGARQVSRTEIFTRALSSLKASRNRWG